MAYSDDSNSDEESGSALRSKLEQALKVNKDMESELRTYKAQEILQEKGFDLVKVEDLAEVPLAEVESRAEALQSERTELKTTVLRDFLSNQGVSGEDLDQMVNEFSERKDAASQEAAAHQRARSLSNVDGKPVQLVDPESVHGPAAIAAGLEAGAKRKG